MLKFMYPYGSRAGEERTEKFIKFEVWTDPYKLGLLWELDDGEERRYEVDKMTPMQPLPPPAPSPREVAFREGYMEAMQSIAEDDYEPDMNEAYASAINEENVDMFMVDGPVEIHSPVAKAPSSPTSSATHVAMAPSSPTSSPATPKAVAKAPSSPTSSPATPVAEAPIGLRALPEAPSSLASAPATPVAKAGGLSALLWR